jgi:hypothetical protein
VAPEDTGLLDLASLLDHLVSAENMVEDVVVGYATQAVATGKQLSDSKTTRPAAQKVVPNTGRRPDCQWYLGIADRTFENIPF